MKRPFGLVAACVVLLTTALSAEATSLGSSELQRVKSSTARFHSLVRAEQAGYVRESPCIPGEGFHYGNASLLADNVIDPERPELLLYELKPNGRLRLVGVEYFKADADQNLSTDADRPSLFGRAFDGPMPGHFPGQPAHFELHVWLWESNPNGIFAVPNPEVNCP